MHVVNRIPVNDDWEFVQEWTEEFLNGGGEAQAVRLPHNAGEVPLHYADPSDYSMICGYRRMVHVPIEAEGKQIFLVFDGAAHIATVFVNGVEMATHRCGYTAFRVDITAQVRFGEDNLVAVRLDTTENPAVPPFGFVIDYLTYGGLYREVWYEERDPSMIRDLYITTPKSNRAEVSCEIAGAWDSLRFAVYDDHENVMAVHTVCAGADTGYGTAAAAGGNLEKDAECKCVRTQCKVPGAKLWDVDDPNVYRLCVSLIRGGAAVDTVEETFGFRHMQWKRDGLYLNGRRVFLRGLNRHQSFPYLGYAAPASLQREDARILKEELCCNAVRTSHYPQSHHFLDACDRLGLLVFTELPGWQHIGDERWKEQALENVREMVSQYRNHPSIFIWGVRINESVDDDAFYRRTNQAAHELDKTRATTGVRYLEKSHLLEDVYAYNDFSHDGTTPGAKPKAQVTDEREKPFLISEHNGHMFPTKAYDPWEKRQEHALRHARVLHAAMSSGEHAGCFGWCMFDYQTHKDFGSGDRICYHGVMDSYRNPKLAAAVYAAQGATPVLEVGSSMDIGDYPVGQTGDIYAFTNAEEVRLYKNDIFVKSFSAKADAAGMHRPIAIDDLIGTMLETQEGYVPGKAKILRECLLSAAKHGMANLPAADKAKMAYCMVRYGLKFKDGVELFGKYVGNWGGAATVWRFDAVSNGKTVASVRKGPSHRLHLEVKVSSTALQEEGTYDMAAVRVRVLDENNNVASYAQLPVSFRIMGEALELAGPQTVTAEGGMCGTYVRTAGTVQETAAAKLEISAPGMEAALIHFTVR